MLTLQQAAKLFQSGETPDKHKRWTDEYYGMTLHTAGARPMFEIDGISYVPPHYFGQPYQYLFNTYLLNKHPREDSVTRNWRLSVYRPMTQGPYLKVIETIRTAIFQNSNYTLSVELSEDSQYLWANNFAGLDIIQYFSDHLKNIIEDPNAYYVIRPSKPAGQYENNEPITPTIVFVPSRFIRYVAPDFSDFAYIDPDNENVGWLINTVGIFRFENQKGKGGRRWVMLDPETGGYYAHMLGYVPAYVAGGVKNTVDKFNESWLVAAKAATDEYISSYSSEQMVDKEASHPFITMAWADCTAPGCNRGYVETGQINEYNIPIQQHCKTCRGTGKVMSQNPGQRLYAPMADMDKDLIKITNPNVAINEYHHEKNKDVLNIILDALNLLKTLQAQSGVAKTIDQEQLYRFVKNISDDIFGRLIFNCVKDIIGYRNVTVIDGVASPYVYPFSLILPSEFGIPSAAELLDELKLSIDASMPDYIRAEIATMYVDRKFNGDAVLDKKTMLIMDNDPLAMMPATIKSDNLSMGVLDKNAVMFSILLPNILDSIIKDYSATKFLKATTESIMKEVQIRFDKLKPPPPPDIQTYAGQA